GTYFSVMSKESFFLMCAAIGAGAGALTLVFNYPLKPILDAKPAAEPILTEPEHLEPATPQAGE
ncbi:MAG: hypothetical protein KGL26_15755, partial [Pseudomonadota bacterium]|nr:hypothetical protein [Pseudomonadota bacterium]